MVEILGQDGNDRVEVAVLSLGSKATGQKFIRKDGRNLNDCHSEILARRALLKWLQFEWDSVFEKVE